MARKPSYRSGYIDGRSASPEVLRHFDDAVEAYIEALGRMFPEQELVAYRRPELDTPDRRYFILLTGFILCYI